MSDDGAPLTRIPAGGSADRRVPRLVISDKAGRRVVEIAKPRFTIGRRKHADLCLPHPDVSRAHAEIIETDDGFMVVDASSSCGTYVNELPTDKTRLFDGDLLRFGGPATARIVFLLSDDDPPTEDAPALVPPEFLHNAKLLLWLSGLGPERVVNEILALVLDSAIDVTGAERGFILLADEGGELECKLARQRGKLPLKDEKYEISRKLPRSVFDTGKPDIVEDFSQTHGHEGTDTLGIRYGLCAPLCPMRIVDRESERRDEKPIGVLYLDSRERGLHSAATLDALVVLSTQAAFAIENARLNREMHDKARTEQELEAAFQIWLGLLPAGNRDGLFYRASGTSVPCRALGGDFFDYVDLPDERVGFIVGDVAGKGPPAAVLAAAALGMFSAEAYQAVSPATLMTRLNRGLLRRPIEARYLTAFYGILAADGQLVFCNAGHNPPLLVTRAGIRCLTTGGCVVGLFDRTTFADGTEKLESGDFIVAYSDGITEALNAAGEEFTDARLIETVEQLRDEPSHAIVAGVISAVRLFCGEGRPNDDVTVVVVRY